MDKKCKYCFSPISEQSSTCSICKIDATKPKNSLTKDEKKVAYYSRAIYLVGFLAIVGGIIGIIASIATLLTILTTFVSSSLPANIINLVLALINMSLAISFLIFGLAVRKFKQWCYIGGIILYAIAIILGVLTRAPAVVVFGILFLSYIASPISKKIFYRQL